MVDRVFVSAHGNVFMREIAEHLVEALVDLDHPAILVTDELPAVGDHPMSNLVVAPHEFFGLFPATAADVNWAAAHAISINTEQAGTPFFEAAMRFAAHAPLVFDINLQSLKAIRHHGLRAVHLPLGYVRSMDHWRCTTGADGCADATRTIDLAFMGGRTPRRELFLAGAAGMLWEWRTDLRVFSWHRPILGGGPTFLAGAAKYDALADTRILLNVHRGDDPYFEWARVVEAAANGCVVASETSMSTEPFVAGEHFVEAPLEYLAEQAVALAFDEARRVRIADAAHELLISRLHQRVLLETALEAGDSIIARNESPTVGAVVRSSVRSSVRTLSGELQPLSAAAKRSMQAARRAFLPTPNLDGEELLRRTAAELKTAYLAQLVHSRNLERAVCEATSGSPDPLLTSHSAVWPAARPKVSVVVPLYNQGHFLGEAMRSVTAAASGAAADTELIVVDDHSTDDSAAIAAELLHELNWFPTMLIRRRANGGLPVARNTGFAAARAPYVFALDADNVLYPSGLRVLVEHLDSAPDSVIAAYGILERFDADGSVGLTSHLPWDVDLLVQGAYIDAMALFRRSAWADVGGYHDSPDVYGWEDYDMWLGAASRGLRADLVTQFVGRYREQVGSMRKISDIDMASNFITLRQRHPRLPWPS